MKLPVITNLLFVDQHTGYSFGIGPAKPEVDSALKFSQKTGSPSFTYDQQGIRFDGKVFVCETQVYGYAVAYTVENTKRLFFLRTELDICSNFQN